MNPVLSRHPSPDTYDPMQWDGPCPLECMSAEEQGRIWRAVLAPRPPPKWIYFGHPDDAQPISYMESRAWLEWHYRRGIDPLAARPAIPAGIRRAVLARDGRICRICGGEVPAGRNELHLDHVTPYSRGGRDSVDNLRVTHRTCNIKRKNRDEATS